MMLKEHLACFTHCTYILLEPTGPNKCLFTNLGVEVWVGSFEVGRIVEVFAVRAGVILNWKTSMFFLMLPKVVVWYRKGKFILCNLHSLLKFLQ